MENPVNILEVRNLVTQFRTEHGIVRAVDDISFDLRKGETLGIVGESGSGKSITALSVMQLLPKPAGSITNGSIRFQSPGMGEIDLTQVGTADMRSIRGKEISMIFQEPMTSLNPVFTCGHQVMEAVRLHLNLDKDAARKKTLDLFEQVRLPRPADIFNAYPHQISGGQKQRVMIAMAMSCNPSILIADEPTTALDVTVQKTILDLMADLRRETGMSIMFITHDLGVVAEVCDFVLVMYRGKIVEYGPVLEIFRNPQHPYTKGLIGCRPRMDVRLRVLPTVTDFMKQKAKSVEVADSVEQVLQEMAVSPAEHAQRQVDLAKQTPILEVTQLKTWFPLKKTFLGRVTDWVKAVNDVSLVVYPGETLGLVGESGCGKTTLGRSILRLQEPSEGSIRFMGRDITHLNEKDMREVRRDMQIIFQDPYSSLNPRMTIGNAILEPMRVHGVLESDKARIHRVYELLERVNLLPEHFHRYPHEFSGGQRQRVCIARALALKPRFIICDESVSALDVSVQAQVLNLLIELRREFDFTYIFISHDLSVVKFMSDRMIVMNEGRIQEMGVADEIYANPQSEYTRKLIASIPRGSVADIEQRLRIRAH